MQRAILGGASRVVASLAHCYGCGCDMRASTPSQISADMVVMGAYGRSRLRELILGGATHSMLKHMTVPVLMSH